MRELQAADKKDEADGAIENTVLGFDNSTVRGDIYSQSVGSLLPESKHSLQNVQTHLEQSKRPNN